MEVWFVESQANILQRERQSAICVQEFDDSLNPAIHITYRILLRSSSLREPRDPSLMSVVVVGHCHIYCLVPLHGGGRQRDCEAAQTRQCQ